MEARTHEGRGAGVQLADVVGLDDGGRVVVHRAGVRQRPGGQQRGQRGYGEFKWGITSEALDCELRGSLGPGRRRGRSRVVCYAKVDASFASGYSFWVITRRYSSWLCREGRRVLAVRPALLVVEFDHLAHDFGGVVLDDEEIQVVGRDHAVGQQLLAQPVDQAVPEFAAHQHDGAGGTLPVWIRVSASNSSSRVPNPPGMAT